MMGRNFTSNHTLVLPYLALITICFIWGTTYLAIRIALQSTTPLLIVFLRYGIAGFVLLLVAIGRSASIPKGKELFRSVISGVMVLAVGNLSIAYSEQLIPSSTTALLLTLFPFWLVGMEAIYPDGERLRRNAVLGMLAGFVGATMLITRKGDGLAFRNSLAGFLILQAGMAVWSLGSIYQRRQSKSIHPIVGGAIQQLAGSLTCLLLILVSSHQKMPDRGGALAVLYLTLFGSIVGYSCYVYALARLPVSIVSVYPYVNVIVAVTVGWWAFREPFGWRGGFATALILVGIIIVKYEERRAARDAASIA